MASLPNIRYIVPLHPSLIVQFEKSTVPSSVQRKLYSALFQFPEDSTLTSINLMAGT